MRKEGSHRFRNGLLRTTGAVLFSAALLDAAYIGADLGISATQTVWTSEQKHGTLTNGAKIILDLTTPPQNNLVGHVAKDTGLYTVELLLFAGSNELIRRSRMTRSQPLAPQTSM